MLSIKSNKLYNILPTGSAARLFGQSKKGPTDTMTKTLYMTLYKAAVDNLNQWIKDFNEQVAKHNEQVAAFNKSIPADLESRRLLERKYNQLIEEWQKLIRKVQEAEKTFRKDLLGMIETQPMLPNRPDQPDYTVHRLLANLGKPNLDIHQPKGRYPDASPPKPKPIIPSGAKFDQPNPFAILPDPLAPGNMPNRLQATLEAQTPPVQKFLKEQQPPASLKQTAINYIRKNWRPVTSDVAITAAAGLAGFLAAMLADRYINKLKGKSQMLDNQEPVPPKPVEDVSFYVPPAVPYV
jgi:hypothetical protein